jgi:arsenate reductase (glutaredoxin)
MALILFGIPNCDTVKKARIWLDAHGTTHDFHDYKKRGIDAGTLGRWVDTVGIDALINRAGTTFRKLDDADKAGLDRRAAIALMIAHPSIIKRPVAEGEGVLLVGFKPDLYAATFA